MQQQPPAPWQPGLVPYYTLLSVAVLKGSTAWAVGGAINANFNVGYSAGTILATVNGGFTWTLAARAPCLHPSPPACSLPREPLCAWLA